MLQVTSGRSQNVTEYCIKVHKIGPADIGSANSATIWRKITINDTQNARGYFKFEWRSGSLRPPPVGGLLLRFNNVADYEQDQYHRQMSYSLSETHDVF